MILFNKQITRADNITSSPNAEGKNYKNPHSSLFLGINGLKSGLENKKSGGCWNDIETVGMSADGK